MMFNILSYYSKLQKPVLFACAFLTALAMCSCIDDINAPAETSDPEAGYITIALTSTNTASRAETDEEGLDNLNENYIGKALICLYPSGAAETDRPVLMQTVTFGTNTTKTATAKIRINLDIIARLFPSGSTAKAYVIVNLPETTAVPADVTIEGLKQLTIDSKFGEQAIQNSFVMDGTNDVTLAYDEANPSKSKITGKVNLTRAASKINLAVKVAETVTDGNGTEWESKPDAMRVYFTNGVKKSAVTPSSYTLRPEDYYSIPSSAARSFSKTESETDEYPHKLGTPFYTYPNSWTVNDSENMTYMTLVLPWQKSGETAFRYCYYTVPVVNGTSIVRNVSYQVNIDVGILGSFTQDSPLPLEDLSYRAVEWGSAPVEIEINDYRYLVIDRTDFSLNNEASVNIPFYSTHNTTVTSTKVTYYLYNFSAEGNEEAVEITKAQNEASTTTVDGVEQHIYSAEVNNDIDPVTSTRTLTFNHPLYQWTPYDRAGNKVVLNGVLNTDGELVYPTGSLDYLTGTILYYNRTEDQSFSRYDIEITIVHTDKKDAPDADLYTKTIKITQYPGMYVEAYKNVGATYEVNQGDNDGTVIGNFGYAFVNASRNNQIPYWTCSTYGRMLPLDNASNNGNPNMYVITISQLDLKDQYVIGDPRSTEINNLNNTGLASAAATWCNSADDMEGVNRKLTYYYPTREENDTKMVIAPKIRIASSFGEMKGRLSPFNCKRRCATYQERGYPAGRWRVPTYGEMKYIVELTLAGKIPKLFNTYDGEDYSSAGARYYTAQGIYVVSEKTGELIPYTGATESAYVRPVYDEWYWTDELPYDESAAVGLQYVYTFGDRER